MKKENLKKEQVKLGRAWDSYKEHRDSLDSDQTTWSAEDRTKFDELDKDVDAIEARISTLKAGIASDEKDADREKRFEERNLDGVKPDTDNKNESEAETRAKKIFDTFLRSGPLGLSNDEHEFMEKRTLQAGSDVEGGYLIMPQKMVSGLLKDIDDDVAIRGMATIHQLKKAKSLGVVKLDADLEDWEWTTELATGSDDDSIRFGKRELRPHPLAKRVKISNTLIQNAIQNPQALVQQRMVYKLGGTLENNYMIGDGNNGPLGVFVASDDGIDTSRDVATDNTATSVTADGLISAQGKLKGAYGKKAKWLMHRDLITATRKLKSSDLQYLWQPGLTAGVENLILGKPYITSEWAPNTYTAGLYAALYGDFSYYWILDALSMQMQVLKELYAETNQIGYIGRYEGDAQPVLAEAFVRVKMGS